MTNDQITTLLQASLPRRAGDEVLWTGLPGSAAGLVIAEAAGARDGPLLVITPDMQRARGLDAEVRFYGSHDDLPVLEFPDWETLPYDVFSPHQDIVSKRLETLYGLPGLTRGVLICPVPTLMHRTAPRSYVEGHTLLLAVGDAFNPESMRRRLEHNGYRSVSQVVEHGEFAVRGSLFDLYPMGSELPFRIDLFDDEVESIRTFDPDTQRSIERVHQVRLLPAREFPVTEEGIARFRQGFRATFEGDPQRSPVYRDVSQGIAPNGVEYYLPLFFETTGTLFDFLPDNTAVVTVDDVAAAARQFQEQIHHRYEQRRHDRDHPLLPPERLFLEAADLEAVVRAHPRCRLIRDAEQAPAVAEHPLPVTRSPAWDVDTKAPQAKRLQQILGSVPGRILLVAESAGRREALLDSLRACGAAPGVCSRWAAFRQGTDSVGVTVGGLDSGLHLDFDPPVTVVAEAELLGERARQPQRRSPAGRAPEQVVRELTDLHPGAPVVHEDHGIGRYQGLERLTIGGVTTEYLTLEYAGGDRLYVPVSALHLVSRYTGASPENAPLHRLGSEQWQRARQRAARKVHDVAAELLDIYSRRTAREGRGLRAPEADYAAFAAGFPFEETADQHEAIDAVLQDMAAATPMDRVVCGDVGFGKTEVAMRAAFVAAAAGSQVAVLVPTTLLAQQHLENFRDRFADWPIRVEALSRFRSKRQQEEILQGIANGDIDILIGTHKLLQDTTRFKDLGLVIVDEEHRFGVRQKERLKALRSEVDVLTMTATPIPRTMNMALGGLRSLSIIATPPARRLAIKTFVGEWNGAVIQDACMREIKRGGQVYFLHNDVDTIDRAARELGELLPGTSIRIAHGQMRERDLERVMLDFYHQRFDILVCSTIIESGIDVPNANTMIINRADRLGLAQLHQIRGRVGRSHHRAYAYLVVPPRQAMTDDAVKRLEAVESLEDLGSGFMLATHDLEIRGAGDLLGEEQSGQIHEVGFAFYTELLDRAVQALKSGREPDLQQPLRTGPEVELRVPALIPEDYVPDIHTRLTLYKRIANAADDAALDELQIEMIDRFGLLPEPAKLLFEVTALRLKAAPLGVRKVEAGETGGRLVFDAEPRVDPGRIVQLIQQHPQTYRLDGTTHLRFSMEMPEPRQRIQAVDDLLGTIAARDAA